jgi:hypothetical protein
MISKTKEELFELVKKAIDNNFITSMDQLEKPSELDGNIYRDIPFEMDIYTTKLMTSQKLLFDEVIKYIDKLTTGQFLKLIDRYPIFDLNILLSDSTTGNRNLLTIAMDLKKLKLCEELVKRGATIVYHDAMGEDATPRIFDKRYIDEYKKLDNKYIPGQSFTSILPEILHAIDKELEKPDKNRAQ